MEDKRGLIKIKSIYFIKKCFVFLLIISLLSQAIYGAACSPKEIRDFIDQNVKAGVISSDRNDEVYAAATVDEKKARLAEEISELINNGDLTEARDVVEKSNLGAELKDNLFNFIDNKQREFNAAKSKTEKSLSVEELSPTLEVNSGGAVLTMTYSEELQEFIANEKTWKPKDEFHVTLIGFGHQLTKKLKEKYKLSNKDAGKKAEELMNNAAKNIVFKVKRTNNYRVVEKDGKRTIIELVEVEGLDKFYDNIEQEVEIIRSPPHITIYTGEDKQAIGVTSQKDLEQYSRELTEEELGGLNYEQLTKTISESVVPTEISSEKQENADKKIAFTYQEIIVLIDQIKDPETVVQALKELKRMDQLSIIGLRRNDGDLIYNNMVAVLSRDDVKKNYLLFESILVEFNDLVNVVLQQVNDEAVNNLVKQLANNFLEIRTDISSRFYTSFLKTFSNLMSLFHRRLDASNKELIIVPFLKSYSYFYIESSKGSNVIILSDILRDIDWKNNINKETINNALVEISNYVRGYDENLLRKIFRNIGEPAKLFLLEKLRSNKPGVEHYITFLREFDLTDLSDEDITIIGRRALSYAPELFKSMDERGVDFLIQEPSYKSPSGIVSRPFSSSILNGLEIVDWSKISEAKVKEAVSFVINLDYPDFEMKYGANPSREKSRVIRSMGQRAIPFIIELLKNKKYVKETSEIIIYTMNSGYDQDLTKIYLKAFVKELGIQLDNYNKADYNYELIDVLSKIIDKMISEVFNNYSLVEEQILLPAEDFKKLSLSSEPKKEVLRYKERLQAIINFMDTLDLGKVNNYRFPFYIKMILENEEEINKLSKEKKQQLIKRIIAQADKDFLDFQKQVFYNNKVDDNYYAMYLGLLMQLAGKDNFNENIRDILDKLKISSKGKTREQIIQEIDIILETVDVKPSVKSFSFESEIVEIKLPEDLYNPLREMIRSVMEIKDISEIIKGLQKRVKQIEDDIKKSNKDSLIKLGVPAGLINSNIKDKDLRINEFIFKNKFELSPEELNALIQLAFLKTGNENLNLINNFAAEKELSVEDMNTLLTVLSELEGSEKEESQDEEREVQRGLIDALKDVDVEMLLGSVKKSDKWQLITRLKQAKIENKNLQNKVSKNIEVVFAQKNILDLFQGRFSGTCFGDCPYDMARPQILVAKILDDKKLAGGILFYVLDNKLIMIGFDPSEALVGSLSSEKKNELIDYLMKSVHGFAKENNFELYITNEAGGLSNRAGFEEYIINNYRTTASEQVKDKTGRKVKLQFHPNYEYEVRNINPALNLEKTSASSRKIESFEKSVKEQSKTLELTQLKREELEIRTKIEHLDNLWFWQKWFRNVPKEKAELNARLQEIESSVLFLSKSTPDESEEKQTISGIESIPVVEEKISLQVKKEEEPDLKNIKASKRYQDQLKHTYVAVMTDIDGTITDENHQIPDAVLQKIYELIINDFPVVITTGRDKDGVKKIISDIKKLHKNKAQLESEKVLEQALRNLFLFVQNGAYGFTAHNEEVVHIAEFPEKQITKEEIKKIVESLKLSISNINIKEFSIVISLKNNQDINKYTEIINNKLSELDLPLIAINTGTTVDITPKGVSKGLALEQLVEILNREYGGSITSSDVLRIGDNGQRDGNDYEMLKGFGGFSVDRFDDDVIPLIDDNNNQMAGYKASLWLLDHLNFKKNNKRRALHSTKTGKTLVIDDIVEQKEIIPIKREKIQATDEKGVRYTIWRPFLSNAQYGKAYVLKTDEIPKDVDERSLLEELIEKTEKEGDKYPEITSTLYDSLMQNYLDTIKRASNNLKDHTNKLEKEGVDYAIFLPLMGAESLLTTMSMFNDLPQDKVVRVSSSSSIFNRNPYVQAFLRDLLRKHKSSKDFELIVLDEVISGSSVNNLNNNINLVLAQLKEEEIRATLENILIDIKAGRENEVIARYEQRLKTSKFRSIIESIKKGAGGTYELYNLLKDLNYYTDNIKIKYVAVTSSDVGATKINQANYVKMRDSGIIEEFSMAASAIRLTEDASYAQAYSYKKAGSVVLPQLEKKKDASDYYEIMQDFAKRTSDKTGRPLEELVLSYDKELLTPPDFGRNAMGQDMIIEILVNGKKIVMTFATILIDIPGDTIRISNELVDYNVYNSQNKLENDESLILKDNIVTKDGVQWPQLLKLRNILNEMSKTLKDQKIKMSKITATTVYDRNIYELEYDDEGNVKSVNLLSDGKRIPQQDIKDIILQEVSYTFNTAGDTLAKIPVKVDLKDGVLTKSKLLEENKARKSRISSELLKSQSLRKYVKKVMDLLDNYNYDDYIQENELRKAGIADNDIQDLLDLINRDLEVNVNINEPISSSLAVVG